MSAIASIPLDRLFAAPDLSGVDVRQAAFSADGAWLAYLRTREAEPTATDLWVVRTSGGAPRRLLSAEDDEPDARERARRERQRVYVRGVNGFSWAPDRARLLVPSVEGLDWIDPASGARTAAVGGVVSDPHISPDGGSIAFVRDGALNVAPGDGSAGRRFSPPATADVSFGVAEFVAQEEFARDTGHWWRPDGNAIAYTAVDESCVGWVSWGESGAGGARLVQQRFPLAGRANAQVTLYIGATGTGSPVQVDLGDDADVYLARVAWAQNGEVLYVQRQTRDQQRLDLLAADPRTGETRILLTEERAPWVTILPDFAPLADGSFLWLSDRSGHTHLYHYAADGSLIRAVTEGAWSLASRDRDRAIAAVDEVAGLVYLMASPETALERYLNVADFRRAGPLQRITADAGWWQVTISPGAERFVGRFMSPAQPPRTGLFSIDGSLLRWIEPNALDRSHPYGPYLAGLPTPEFGQLTAEDGQALDYVLIRPTAFDPSRRYPAIVKVYGGPGRQLVDRRWRAPEERAFLDAGYVLFQLDNRGACGRGLAFEAPIAGSLGGPEVRDQLAGLAFLRSLPFVDPDQIGVTGWSYGGFMTLRLMTERGANLAAGIAGASVDDFRNYDTHYSEHYLGHPDRANDAYASSAIAPRLPALAGRLMLIHGAADDNVHFDHALRMIGELQRLGALFELMIYPGARHIIADPAARAHMHRTMLDFFDRWLKGRPLQ